MSKGGVAKVSIGYCHRESLSSFFHASVVNLIRKHHHQVDQVIGVLSGPKIDHARNDIVRTFLRGNAEYLLMVDTDMVLPPDTLTRLLRAKKDIVGGLCFIGSFTGSLVQPSMRILRPEGDGFVLEPMWNYPKDEVIQVSATGAACILIHKRVLKAIELARGKDFPLPWFAHGMHNGVEIGEDIGFCLTAGAVGFDTWVDTGLVIPHVKPRFISQEEYVASLSEANHPHYDERENVPIYQELTNVNGSLDSDRQGGKELQVS